MSDLEEEKDEEAKESEEEKKKKKTGKRARTSYAWAHVTEDGDFVKCEVTELFPFFLFLFLFFFSPSPGHAQLSIGCEGEVWEADSFQAQGWKRVLEGPLQSTSREIDGPTCQRRRWRPLCWSPQTSKPVPR